MAFDKKAVVQYSYYMMVSSYFKSYRVANRIVEDALFMHYQESKNDFQYSCEDFAVYSIENILPGYIGDIDLSEYDAVIKMNKETGVLTVDAGKLSWDVICDYENGSPVLTYSNVKKPRGRRTKKTDI